MLVKIDCPKCNGKKYIYEDVYTKCRDCITYQYSGLQPPFCSEGVVGCNRTSKVMCNKCNGEGTIVVDGEKIW